jgi:hypothetical protein
VSSAAPVRAYPERIKEDALFRSAPHKFEIRGGRTPRPRIARKDKIHIELAQFLRIERVLICGFRDLQAPVVVSPRSASSSWTTPPVPSSVTSRAQVCDSEFYFTSPNAEERNKRHLLEDQERGGKNTGMGNIEDPTQPDGTFCFSSANSYTNRTKYQSLTHLLPHNSQG